MSKLITLCLKCGNAQVRTDIEKVVTERYIVLDKWYCPNCSKITKQIATKDTKKLRQTLEKDSKEPIDEYIIKLIKR